MGAGIARRLMRNGHECVVFDRNAAAVEQLGKEGALGANDLAGIVHELRPPRTVWVMLPAGAPTDETIDELGALLARGDTIIDGGNSYYRDDIRRARTLREKGVSYLDVGTSGGPLGEMRGYCLMIGGEKPVADRHEPIFSALAPGGDGKTPAERGHAHVGPAGAGHFVKMVHNGIEYGLMQAYAEGFDILQGKANSASSEERFDLDLAAVAEVWRHGSIISSRLLDLTAEALKTDGSLMGFEGVVEDSGEGRWTLEAATEQATPAPVLAAALFARFRSREKHTFAEKVLSAMRFGFGGHVEARR